MAFFAIIDWIGEDQSSIVSLSAIVYPKKELKHYGVGEKVVAKFGKRKTQYPAIITRVGDKNELQSSLAGRRVRKRKLKEVVPDDPVKFKQESASRGVDRQSSPHEVASSQMKLSQNEVKGPRNKLSTSRRQKKQVGYRMIANQSSQENRTTTTTTGGKLTIKKGQQGLGRKLNNWTVSGSHRLRSENIRKKNTGGLVKSTSRFGKGRATLHKNLLEVERNNEITVEGAAEVEDNVNGMDLRNQCSQVEGKDGDSAKQQDTGCKSPLVEEEKNSELPMEEERSLNGLPLEEQKEMVGEPQPVEDGQGDAALVKETKKDPKQSLKERANPPETLYSTSDDDSMDTDSDDSNIAACGGKEIKLAACRNCRRLQKANLFLQRKVDRLETVLCRAIQKLEEEKEKNKRQGYFKGNCRPGTGIVNEASAKMSLVFASVNLSEDQLTLKQTLQNKISSVRDFKDGK